MSSYFVAFSNDSRDWTTLHDGYAEWVSAKCTIQLQVDIKDANLTNQMECFTYLQDIFHVSIWEIVH